LPLLDHPPRIGPRRDNADDVLDVVVEFTAESQEQGPIVWAWDDPVPAELPPEDVDLGLQEPNTGVPPGGAGFPKEV
jgi:hypothetical protein